MLATEIGAPELSDRDAGELLKKQQIFLSSANNKFYHKSIHSVDSQ